MIKTMTQLNLESLETRTLLAVGDVLDGEMADKVADLAGKLLEDVFSGDSDKLSDAETLAKKYLGVADEADSAVAEGNSDVDEAEPKKKKSNVKKLTSKFEKLAGGFFSKLTGSDSDESDGKGDVSEDKEEKSEGLFDKIGDTLDSLKDKVTGSSSAKSDDKGDASEEADSGEGEEDESENLLDKIGDKFDSLKDKITGGSSGEGSDSESDGLLDKIGGAFDKITGVFGGNDSDEALDASGQKLSGVLDRVRARVHAFGGEDSPAGGKIGSAAAHLMDVTGDVIDRLTGFIDDATDASPEREQRIETALKVAAAALEGVSGVSSLVGVAVPGVSAAGPALSAASDVLENASGKTSAYVKATEKIGNIVGKGGHKIASVLDGISDRLDPTADADEATTVEAEVASPEGSTSHEVGERVIALNEETKVLVA